MNMGCWLKITLRKLTVIGAYIQSEMIKTSSELFPNHEFPISAWPIQDGWMDSHIIFLIFWAFWIDHTWQPFKYSFYNFFSQKSTDITQKKKGVAPSWSLKRMQDKDTFISNLQHWLRYSPCSPDSTFPGTREVFTPWEKSVSGFTTDWYDVPPSYQSFY